MGFSWAEIQTAEVLERSRAPRFRPEWREILLGYFGLKPGMRVLEVGSGPGTLAPYLAAGMAPEGHVVGLDLDPAFVARARERAPRDGSVSYVVGDAYHLPFPDGSFDAAVSYTGIGVLTDPERALAEMVRVVRPGGSVAVSEAVSGPLGFRFDGRDSLPGPPPYPEAPRYWALRRRILASLDVGRPSGIGNPAWPPEALSVLLAEAGVVPLRLNAWGYVRAADDAREDNPLQVKEASERDEDAWVAAVRRDPDRAHLLASDEWNEWNRVRDAHRRWRRQHSDYAYEAGLSLVIQGCTRAEERS